MEKNINEIKKFLKSEVERLGDKLKIDKIENDKILATITREDGRNDKVYWLLDLVNGGLKSVWYYEQK